MANASAAKGNPASRRMSNSHHKEKFQKAWKRSQTRKAQRVQAQQEREKNNKALRAAGKPTPWETAEHERSLRRAAHPPQKQPRTDMGNIIKPDGTVVPCCQAKSRMTGRRIKCPHLGSRWLEYASSSQGRETYRGGI